MSYLPWYFYSSYSRPSLLASQLLFDRPHYYGYGHGHHGYYGYGHGYDHGYYGHGHGYGHCWRGRR